MTIMPYPSGNTRTPDGLFNAAGERIVSFGGAVSWPDNIYAPPPTQSRRSTA